jgi:hypothetical protein
MYARRFAALAALPLLIAGCATASVNPPTTAPVAPVAAAVSAPAKFIQPEAETVLTAPHAQDLHGYPVVLAKATVPETFVTFDLLVRPGSLVIISLTDAKGNSLGDAWVWFVLKSQHELYESHPAGNFWQVVSLADQPTGSIPYSARVSLDFQANTMYTRDGKNNNWISLDSTVVVEGMTAGMHGPIARATTTINRPSGMARRGAR